MNNKISDNIKMKMYEKKGEMAIKNILQIGKGLVFALDRHKSIKNELMLGGINNKDIVETNIWQINFIDKCIRKYRPGIVKNEQYKKSLNDLMEYIDKNK